MAPGLRRGLLQASAAGCAGAMLAIVALLAFASVLAAGDDEPAPLEDARVLALHSGALLTLAVAAVSLWGAGRRAPEGIPGPPGRYQAAGTILVLIGTILHVAVIPTFLAIGLWPALATLHWDDPLGPVLGMAALVLLPGATTAGITLGWIAWRQARRGVPCASRLALVASFLPPWQAVTFVGGLLLGTRPEAQRTSRRD